MYYFSGYPYTFIGIPPYVLHSDCKKINFIKINNSWEEKNKILEGHLINLFATFIKNHLHINSILILQIAFDGNANIQGEADVIEGKMR